MEDGTGTALAFISGDACRQWLRFPAGVWKALEEQILPQEGEFLYVGSKATTTSGSLAGRILSFYCHSSTHLRRPLDMTADRMVNNNNKGTSHGVY